MMERQNGEAGKLGLHVGHYLLNALKEYPDVINQIDGYTGEEETNRSVVERSVRLAASMRKYGLQPGDVVAYAGRNHINVHIPYYASMFEGLALVGVDPAFKTDEIRILFAVTRPNIVFCDDDKLAMINAAANILKLNTKIVTYDGEYDVERFTEEYKGDIGTIDDYNPADLDPEKTFCWLVCTSGTTGVSKAAAYTHATIVNGIKFYKAMQGAKPYASGINLHLSPVQWVSTYTTLLLCPFQPSTRLTTSGPIDTSHLVDIINKYKPTNVLLGMALATQLLKSEHNCDLSCFKTITIVGSKVNKDILVKMKEKTKAQVTEIYGQTETLGPVFNTPPNTPLGSCGMSNNRFLTKIFHPESEEPIEEANKTGELRIKGPIFTEYYNNPEEMAKAFSKDGWFKTGDLFYKDENNFYFFVERQKMLIKYKNYHILPPELEEVILAVDGVEDAVVVAIPHPEFSEVPAACVVKAPKYNVTAQQIKDAVAEKLSDAKQLRGGVVFVDEIPLTSSGKPAKNKIIELLKSVITF